MLIKEDKGIMMKIGRKGKVKRGWNDVFCGPWAKNT